MRVQGGLRYFRRHDAPGVQREQHGGGSISGALCCEGTREDEDVVGAASFFVCIRYDFEFDVGRFI